MSAKRALITGASSDIGIMVARRFLTAGMSVVGHYHKGQQSFFDLAEEFPSFKPLCLDLEDTAAIETYITENPDVISDIDVLINGAAELQSIRFDNIKGNDLVRALKVNLIPGILLMQAVTPTMVERGWGRIVHLSSIGVKFGGGTASFCYALSKHAQEFMPADHKMWAGHNVFVNAIRIGVTNTRIHRNDPTKDMNKRIQLIPAKRMASPEEIAETVFWYGSENNTFTTGQTITVAGGE